MDESLEQEISNLQVTCPYFEAGCRWEGKFHEYHQHKENCDTQFDLPSYKNGDMHSFHCIAFSESPATQSFEKQQKDSHRDKCCVSVQLCELEDHRKSCLLWPEGQQCSAIGPLSSPNESYMEDRYEHEQHLHMQESDPDTGYNHLASCHQLLKGEVMPVQASDHEVGRIIVINTQMERIVQRFQVLLHDEVQGIQSSLFSFAMQEPNEEIASLKSRLTKLEEQIRWLNAKLEEHDFRLSLIENSNHDGSMLWNIPQFSRTKANAENGKYTSIVSLPFYSGRYGYKMCLRLYIMGDGIGKGTHLSLFFVVMHGEFDNILQWPFTHKVTFKLINQAGGRDIIDTFQPNPVSNSFRKPKSDMNIASGCPRFVSHTELEGGGFIVDDTIFIKCSVDTSTMHHP